MPFSLALDANLTFISSTSVLALSYSCTILWIMSSRFSTKSCNSSSILLYSSSGIYIIELDTSSVCGRYDTGVLTPSIFCDCCVTTLGFFYDCLISLLRSLEGSFFYGYGSNVCTSFSTAGGSCFSETTFVGGNFFGFFLTAAFASFCSHYIYWAINLDW